MKSNYDNVCSISHYIVRLILFSLFYNPLILFNRLQIRYYFRPLPRHKEEGVFLFINYELFCILFTLMVDTKKRTGSLRNLGNH